MWKIIKFTLGFLLLISIGLFYGFFRNAVDEIQEDKVYSYISFLHTESNGTITLLIKVPESKCESIREEHFTQNQQTCNGCEVLQNSCVDTISDEYLSAFEQKKISSSYVYIPTSRPIVYILNNFPKDMFSQVCSAHKGFFENAVCIE
jgi:hypothetical protein